MTVVVGLLNKNGVAIAADSAVTRNSRGKDSKITNNGNKMLRLSNVDPVAIMVAGNADFLGTPWDVIIRRYRELKGKEHHSDVISMARDFMSFIAHNNVFWDRLAVGMAVTEEAKAVFSKALLSIERPERNKDFTLSKPREFEKRLRNALKEQAKNYSGKRSEQFRDYSIEDFARNGSPAIERIYNEYRFENLSRSKSECYPIESLEKVRDIFLKTLFSRMGSMTVDKPRENLFSELVFCGYGERQRLPSMVHIRVCGGVGDRAGYHINYHILENVRISRNTTAIMRSFAATEVIDSLLEGMWKSKYDCIRREATYTLSSPAAKIGFRNDWEEIPEENRRKWEEMLGKFDLGSMAALADSLVQMTAFYRLLTFKQEEVGGELDLAIISRSKGFNWLKRKSWYHHIDDGKHGVLGV